MAEAARARRELLSAADNGQLRPTSRVLTVNQLLDLYLDGLDADERLSAKTRFDYRHYADSYVRPHLGTHKVRDVTTQLVIAWQRRLTQSGGTKKGKPLAPNTVHLARSPLSGAFKMAQSTGIIGTNPLAKVPRPAARRSVAKHWTPEQAREFLALMEGDRTYPIWAFLLGSGLRIGELVWLRWTNVDMTRKKVRIVEFASTLGWDLRPSAGKSRDAVRTIDLDDGLLGVLRLQRSRQAVERLAKIDYEESEYVFTRPGGGATRRRTRKALPPRGIGCAAVRLESTTRTDRNVQHEVAAQL